MPRKTYFLTSALLAAMVLPATLAAQEEAVPQQSHTTLDVVVVTANRTEEKLREVSSNVTVISPETIKNSSAANLGELMRQQGFQVSGYNNGGKTITIRGMNQSQGGNDMNSAVLVLLNGRRFGGPTMDYIGLANVERIEIIRGPAAVQYGPAGMGGVINIITRRGSETTTIYAEAGAGSFNLEKVKLAASGQSETGRVDFSFGFGQQHQGDYKTGNGWTWKNTSSGNKIGLNTDLGLNFYDHHRLGLEFNSFRIRGADGGLQTTWGGGVSHHHPKPPGLVNSGHTIADITNNNTAISYEGRTDDGNLNWMARYSFGKHTRDSAGYNSSGRRSSTSNNELSNKNLTANLGYNGDRWSVSGGVDYIAYEVDNRATWGGSKSEFKDLGFFLSSRLRLFDESLILSAGGRYDRYQVEDKSNGYSMNDNHFSPSVGLTWLPLGDWLKFRTNYSMGFRMPTVGEMWPSGSQQLPSPDLKPEESKTLEMGIDVSWEFINASLTYFHSKWENKVFSHIATPTGCFDSGGNPAPCFKNINIKGATLAGWELALSADIGQALNQNFELRPYVNLTWLPTRRNNDRTGGSRSVQALGFDALTDVSEMTVAYGVNFHEPDIDLTVNLNVTYAGEKMTANWMDYPAINSLYQCVWEPHTPGSIVDLMVEKRIADFQDKGKLKVRAEINNLLDKYDEAYMHYPGPGRNFYVGLSYTY